MPPTNAELKTVKKKTRKRKRKRENLLPCIEKWNVIQCYFGALSFI